MGTNPDGHEPLTPAVFHVLLALVGGARHGYAIMQNAEEVSGMEMGPGTIYGTLQRLEASGWVEESGPPRDEKPDGRRRYFALTEAGLDALRSEAVRLDRLTRLARDRALLPEAGGG